MSPSSFPPTRPCPGTAFPLQGSSGRFPRFIGTSQCSDFSSFVPRHFVAFVRRYQPRTRVRSHRAESAPLAGQELVCRSPFRLPRSETTRSPRFLGILGAHALLYDPGETSHPATAVHWYCLPRYPRRRLSRRYSFRGSITRPTYSLSTLRSSARADGHRARLASGWRLPFAGRDRPARTLRVVSADAHLHGVLLTQASPGARAIEFSKSPNRGLFRSLARDR